MRNKLRRPLAFLLSAVMIVTMSGTPVHAVADRGQPETGLCEHHAAHTDDCGYTEETPGTPCGHEHTEDCYTEVTECVHEHTPECYPEETEDSVSDNEATPANAEKREPENCPHICDGESGCITEKLDCRHEHDSECGYTESTPGTPCTYVCEICNPQDSGEADEEPETGIIKQEQCSCLTLCTEGQINPDCLVCGAENAGLSDCKGKAEKEDTKQPEDTGICKHHQEHDDACGYQPESEDSEGSPCTYECRICPIEDLIAALPDKVTEDNAEDVRGQLDEILALFSVLTEDEQEQIDLSRCYELQGALDGANDPDLAEGHAAQQEGDEASVTIGGVTTYYTEFAEAWKKAQEGAAENPATVTLLKDVTLTERLTVTSGQNITLTSAKNSDGNDFTMNYAEASASIYSAIEVNSGTFELKGGTINVDVENDNGVSVENDGTFKLTGGAIRVPGYGTSGVEVSLGTATISGGEITVSGLNGNGVKVSSGTATITGGTITANGDTGNGVMVRSDGTATISGGAITADSGVSARLGGTATISGGTITADVQGVYVLKGTATISGGTITADNRGVYVLRGTVTISGGTIEGTGGAIYTSSGTLLEMLGQTGGSPCAYWQGSGPVALTEGQNELPAGTYTVQACSHSCSHKYTHTNGATTHNQTCPACDKVLTEENCSFGTTGECVCGAVLAAALPADLNLTYNGTAQEPGVTVTVDGQTLAAENNYTVTYANNINAGDTAKATVTGTGIAFTGAFTLPFTIKPATPTIAWNPYYQVLTYTGQPADIKPVITLVNGETYDGPIYYTWPGFTNQLVLPTDAGFNGITASIPAKGNYTAASTELVLALTIIKAAAPAITWPAANGLTYGQKLSESTLSGGSTEYGSFAWKNPDTIPTAGTSGYSVTFTPSNSTEQNYEPIAIKTQDVNVTVAQAAPTVTVEVKMSDSAKGRVADLLVTVTGAQNGAAPAGSITLTSDGLNETLTLQNGKTTHKWENLSDKEYTVTAAYSGDTNYKAANSKLTFDAAKKNQESFAISPVEAKTYGDPAFDLASTGGNGSGAVSFTSSDPSVVSINDKTATICKAGTVTITARKAADNNYNEAVAAISVTIGKRPITLTADSFTVVKGAAMPTLTYQTAGLVNSDTFTTDPTMTTSVSDTNTLGEYAIVISGGILTNGDSYQITYVNGKLTVTDKIPVQLTMTANPTSLSGEGTVTLTISGLPSGGEATVSCSDSSINVTGSGTSWKVTLPNETATYTFTANYGGDAQYSSAVATCTVSVTKPEFPTTSQIKPAAPGHKVKKPSVPEVRSFRAKPGKKKLAFSWKKVPGAAGFQIQISTKKGFKGAKTISVSKSNKTYTKKGLKTKKKYYIRIRAYKTYLDKNKKTKRVYGKWIRISKKTR